MIPFSPPYIDEDVIQEVTAVLRSGWLTTGPRVKQLQEDVAAHCAVDHVLAVNSATSALMLVLHWFGVKKGDEVIVPAYTYCATALAVMHLGATPVMVDVEPDFNISVEAMKKAITSKTKAVISVDIAGWPCDYSAIGTALNDPEISKLFTPCGQAQEKLRRPLFIADAAHSFGALYDNRRIGTQADVTVFSLHAVKNLTTAEGGLICLNLPSGFDNAALHATLRLWSLNGQTKDALTKSQSGEWRYDIVYPGFKINMPDVLAAIGIVQLRKYENYILPERRRVFDYYSKTLGAHSWAILPPYHKTGSRSSFHLYPLRIDGIDEEKRNRIIQIVAERKVSVNVHFVPLPMLTVFKNAGYRIGDFPAAYRQYSNEISLPIYPQLTDEQCSLVTAAVIDAVASVR